MEDTVDVKALRAKFHAQAERAPSAVGPYSKPNKASILTELPDNGMVQSKLSPLPPKPVLSVNPIPEPRRFSPHGAITKPPLSHQKGADEDLKPLINDFDNTKRVKRTGELLQNKMLQHIGERKANAFPRSPLPSQRSISEVPPLRKPVPKVGLQPKKPKRPPYVCLDHLRVKTPVLPPQGHPEIRTQERRVRLQKSPFTPTQSFSKLNIKDEDDTYDDTDLPPPPPPPKPPSNEMWKGSFSSQAEEDSEESDIYEHIEEQEETVPPVLSERKKLKEHKQHQELEKREQKERLKKENEYRKKFKLIGEVEVLHTARVREDWQGGKSDLHVRPGEWVEIVRVKNNPEGKWLARNMNGEYGYISNTCVVVDYEEVKRKLRKEAPLPAFPPPVHENEDVYDDIGSDSLNSSLNVSGEVYDDIDHNIKDDFPLPPPEICHDPKKNKKLEKEEKEFRKKFKFDGPISVLCCMMVDPNANIKKGSGKDLSVVRGEILEVIQQTNQKKVLCRNEQGKYGYVPRSYLLPEENEIYDDVDKLTDIYDNDENTSLRT